MTRAAWTLLVGVALLAAPLAAGAQATRRVIRVGYLTPEPRPPDISPVARIFRRELLALGWVEGQHYVLEFRFGDGSARLPALAAELAALPVDLIVAISTPAALAAKAASTTVPIVFGVTADPVERGLVDSLARPGGNMTGFTQGDYSAKQLQTLKEAVPGVSRVAYLCNCPSRQPGKGDISSADARKVGVQVNALARALASTANAGIGGLVVADLSWMATPHFKQIADFTLAHRLPASGPVKRFKELGGLVYYGPRSGQGSVRVATLVDKILRGAKPATLPVEQPTLFELVINLKTAKALGLTIPPSVLARADEIIQ